MSKVIYIYIYIYLPYIRHIPYIYILRYLHSNSVHPGSQASRLPLPLPTSLLRSSSDSAKEKRWSHHASPPPLPTLSLRRFGDDYLGKVSPVGTVGTVRTYRTVQHMPLYT